MGMEIVEEYIKIGDYTNAIKFLNSMIEREPHNNDARLKLVGLYSKQKEPDYHAIKQVLREGEALVPNDTKIKLALAKFYMRRENIESARIRIEDVLILEPNNLEARFMKAQIDALRGDYEQAIRTYHVLLKTNNNRVRLELSDLYLRELNYKMALQLLDEVINSNPKDYRAVVKKIIVYIIKGDYELAFEYMKKEKEKAQKSGDFYDIDFYLRYMLDELEKNEIPKTYFGKQLCEYSSENCISMLNNTYRSGKREIDPIFTCSRAELKEFYETIRKVLKGLEPVRRGLCDDYILDLGENVGKTNKVETSKVIVQTLNNTPQNIILFRPIGTAYATSRVR